MPTPPETTRAPDVVLVLAVVFVSVTPEKVGLGVVEITQLVVNETFVPAE